MRYRNLLDLPLPLVATVAGILWLSAGVVGYAGLTFAPTEARVPVLVILAGDVALALAATAFFIFRLMMGPPRAKR